MSKHLLWTCLIVMASLTISCAPLPRVSAADPTSATPIRTPQSVRPPTAVPLPRGPHTIYVVDPHNGELLSSILIVDPDSLRVVGGIGARYTPEIAFTPDGVRLYVADSYSSRVIRGEHHDVVSVYDARTSALIHDDVEIRNRLLYKVFPDAHPFTFLSRDGGRLFVGQYGDPDIHAMRMTVLDAETFKTLAEYPYPDGDLVPLLDGRLLSVGFGRLQFVQPLTGDTETVPEPPPTQPAPPSPSSAWALSAADHFYRIVFDTQTQAHIRVIDLTQTPPNVIADRVALDIPQRTFSGIDRIAIAPDESRLYVVLAVVQTSDQNSPTEIWALDTKTWTRVGVSKPADPAWQIAVSRDGTQLYSVNPFKKSLSIFDTASFREIGVMHDLGDTPALIVVPPSG